jgi:hypothetical protein
MPATVTTTEYFAKDVKKEQLETERKLRIKAGAIRSWSEESADGWVLYTEWNVIGQ